MSKTAKVLMATGVLGTVAGIGYAVVSHRRNRDDSDSAVPNESLPVDSKPIAPSYSKSTPLSTPNHPKLRQRINWSHVKGGTVVESPVELLTQALRFDPDVDLDELTGARLAASEYGNGTYTELACIVDTEVNRAKWRGLSLYDSLTYQDTFGKQGGTRPASTRLDPKIRHLLAARAVLSGKLRGISRGATRFFNPLGMESMNRRYRKWDEGGRIGKRPLIVSCDALTLLEAWSFDYGKKEKRGNRCPPDRTKLGRRPLAWIGPIPGVNAMKLMLMKPMKRGDEHTRQYEAARDLIKRGLSKV